MLSSFLHKVKPSNSTSSKKVTEERNPIAVMDRVFTTFLSIEEVKTQINESRVTLEQQYNELFIKCVRAQQAKTSPFTVVKYAFQCAQTKKTAQLVIASLVDLERVVLSVGTAEEFCDTAVKLTSIIQHVSDGLSGVLPEVSTRLKQIGEVLEDLVGYVKVVAPQMWVVPSFGREHEKMFSGLGIVDKRLQRDLQPMSADNVFLDELKKRMYLYIDAFSIK